VTRVLVTHNMVMRDVRWLVTHGEYPRQHLWGADALEAAGHEVEYGPFGPPLEARGARLRQQAAMLRRGGIVLAGEAAMARELARLGRPVVGVLHDVGAGLPHWVRRLRLAVCLSRRARDAIAAVGGRPLLLPWGPDLRFAGYARDGDGPVVAAGKSNRDWPTLLAGLARSGAAAEVVVTRDASLPDPPPGVEVVRPSDGAAFLPFQAVLPRLRRASVVAIPIADPDRLTGLSELNDALALGTPVVVTRCNQLDVDVEAIGCGIAVAPGDGDGWAAALARLAEDPALRSEIGARGRAWAEREWNADRFGEGLAEAFAAL
jgi:glycosyltransferase involved in cell wall biosynthesis